MKYSDFHINLNEERISHEFIINEGLRIAMSTSVPSDSLNLLIEYIGKTLSCERAYIFEKNDSGLFDNTYEWCAEGVVPQKDNLQNIPSEDVRGWMKIFSADTNIIIKNIDDTKEKNPVIYGYLYPQEITSLVVSPIRTNDNIIGFFGVDNPPDNSLENISDIFSILGHFIASLLTSRNLFAKLEKLSFSDLLTGFGNRHAMDNYLGGIQKSDSIGMLFCDLMGLKKVNDSYGHQAGDKMIIRACNCIRRAFPDTALFRMGGDEFLVLCPNISEQELHEKTALLKKYMIEESAPMAIGLLWRPDSSESIDRLLTEADAKMYEDKREYYKNKGK
jgi:diguanylate cyclase (GGDEF)-like protein